MKTFFILNIAFYFSFCIQAQTIKSNKEFGLKTLASFGNAEPSLTSIGELTITRSDGGLGFGGEAGFYYTCALTKNSKWHFQTEALVSYMNLKNVIIQKPISIDKKTVEYAMPFAYYDVSVPLLLKRNLGKNIKLQFGASAHYLIEILNYNNHKEYQNSFKNDWNVSAIAGLECLLFKGIKLECRYNYFILSMMKSESITQNEYYIKPHYASIGFAIPLKHNQKEKKNIVPENTINANINVSTENIAETKKEDVSINKKETNKGDVYTKKIDTDEDGIPDVSDKCPFEAGPKSKNGCPQVSVVGRDKDGDGIEDAHDKCPDEPGYALNNGCAALPDLDNDGVEDKSDKCINVPGLKKNNGCPEIGDDVKQTLSLALIGIQFELGSAVMKPSSYRILINVVYILKSHPTYILKISGHADGIGTEAANLKISQDRANEVKNYLLLKGIPAARMIAEGFGAQKPIVNGTDKRAQALNRRVELGIIQ